MPFEINVPSLSGEITKAYLTETGGVTPVNIVSSKQGFGAHIEWKLCGWLGQWLPGNWRLALLLESIGPGDEYSLPSPSNSVPLASGTAAPPDCRTFAHDITIPAGTVNPGTYRAVISLTYEVASGTPGPMAGHANLDYVQVYAF
jgi:hypothetical protein